MYNEARESGYVSYYPKTLLLLNSNDAVQGCYQYIDSIQNTKVFTRTLVPEVGSIWARMYHAIIRTHHHMNLIHVVAFTSDNRALPFQINPAKYDDYYNYDQA